MYALYKLHNWKPSDYYDLGYGEKIVVRAFLKREVEDMKKERE